MKNVLLLLLLLVGTGHTIPISKQVQRFNNTGIYLSINPLAYTEPDGTVIKRRLEITWYGDQVTEDLILLSSDNETFTQFSPVQYPDGFYITDIQLPYLNLEDIPSNSSCVYSYRVSWVEGGSGDEKASACLRVEPSWMWEHRDQIAQMEVGSLVLAGSHDAGAYKDFVGEGDNNLVTSAVYAQEETLYYQLVWGVRFLDIRIGYYPSLAEKFWLVHGIIKTHPLMEGIQDVQHFLRSTRDVLVWEINGFEQPWSEEGHLMLKELLLKEFGPWLVTPESARGWDATLQQIWDREDLAKDEGRIIITYNDRHTDPLFFFPEIKQRWGNVDEPAELRSFLEVEVERATNNPSYQPWKPNCQLTPTEIDIIGGRWSGLRAMAEAVNRNVTSWWREEWFQLGATFSIHDFVLSTDMVQENIRRNMMLAEFKKT